jgi:peptidoglycan/LPS O-acetylase OafA/YrhL
MAFLSWQVLVAPIENDLSARSRFLAAITGMIILSWFMYYFNCQLAQGVQVQDVDIKMNVELKAKNL